MYTKWHRHRKQHSLFRRAEAIGCVDQARVLAVVGGDPRIIVDQCADNLGWIVGGIEQAIDFAVNVLPQVVLVVVQRMVERGTAIAMPPDLKQSAIILIIVAVVVVVVVLLLCLINLHHPIIIIAIRQYLGRLVLLHREHTLIGWCHRLCEAYGLPPRRTVIVAAPVCRLHASQSADVFASEAWYSGYRSRAVCIALVRLGTCTAEQTKLLLLLLLTDLELGLP
jgi:hypothetical protein